MGVKSLSVKNSLKLLSCKEKTREEERKEKRRNMLLTGVDDKTDTEKYILKKTEQGMFKYE